jgi:GNAT superfamily N-acetyltransferase
VGDNRSVGVRSIPGQEHLPWAETWLAVADEPAWHDASRAARKLGKTGLEVWTTDDRPEVVRFLAARGYEEAFRYLRYALDVAAAPDPGDPRHEVTTLALRPGLLPHVYAVALESYPDQPGREDAEIGAIEDWCEFAVAPNPPDAFMIALEGGNTIGFAILAVEGDEGEHAHTGVSKPWRGQGVAESLKRAHIRWAKAYGLRVLRTANEVRIPQISRLNERYGYRREPDEIVLRGPLASN